MHAVMICTKYMSQKRNYSVLALLIYGQTCYRSGHSETEHESICLSGGHQKIVLDGSQGVCHSDGFVGLCITATCLQSCIWAAHCIDIYCFPNWVQESFCSRHILSMEPYSKLRFDQDYWDFKESCWKRQSSMTPTYLARCFVLHIELTSIIIRRK